MAVESLICGSARRVDNAEDNTFTVHYEGSHTCVTYVVGSLNLQVGNVASSIFV